MVKPGPGRKGEHFEAMRYAEQLMKAWQPTVRSARALWLPLLAICLSLGVLAGVILVAKEQLRLRVRDQIARRDAEVLHAVSLMLQHQHETDYAASWEDPFDQFNLILDASRIRGVIAVRLFTPDGECLDAFPEYILPADKLESGLMKQLSRLKPGSLFRPDVRLESITGMPGPEGTVPLLEVYVPLQLEPEGRLVGIAQFMIEGQSIAAEYADLDKHLQAQATFGFLAGSVVLVSGLGWAFYRLQRMNRVLKARTDSLVKANEELLLAAKTTAVGAVTSHLLHGLKNPLAGLQEFVSSRGTGTEGENWEQAEAATRRMQMMIYEVLELLREDPDCASYDLSIQEVAAMVASRVQPLARERGVRFVSQVECDRSLSNRAAQLSAMILVNLVQNAVEATPAGKEVLLRISTTERGVSCEVHDQGGGIPMDVAGRLFAPGPSTKPNGTGLGLALCRQLARHLATDLELKSNSPGGCTFSLLLPAALLSEPPLVPI